MKREDAIAVAVVLLSLVVLAVVLFRPYIPSPTPPYAPTPTPTQPTPTPTYPTPTPTTPTPTPPPGNAMYVGTEFSAEHGSTTPP